jgi:hypothetical protein
MTDILSQVSVGALAPVTLGMHHETDVADCITSVVIYLTSCHIPSPISRSPMKESNGHQQSRLDRNNQKIQPRHRDQMSQPTSWTRQCRLSRNRKTKPRSPRPSPSNHKVNLHSHLLSSTTNNITKSFLGTSKEPKGLLFTEANQGDLQNYLDTHKDDISEDLRLKWCLQAAEAIAYLHSKGVIHSDLRPSNYLLHASNDDSNPDLLLSDFGGSYCKTANKTIDGQHLPDSGFFNPNHP